MDRDVGVRETLAHGGKCDQHETKTGRRTEPIDGRLQQIVLLLHVEEGDTQHRAIGSDQRQENTQDSIQ